MTNDFTVVPHVRGGHVGELFAIKAGRTVLVAVNKNKEYLEGIAAKLNIDPWFLDRGYTKADRCAGY